MGTKDALTSLKFAAAPKLKKTATLKQFTIFGNYPNPFNPDTTIEFVIPDNSHVEVDIYTITGQKIRSLISEQLTAGKHSTVWGGENDAGLSVSTGVYFVRLKTETEVLSHRILLMR